MHTAKLLQTWLTKTGDYQKQTFVNLSFLITRLQIWLIQTTLDQAATQLSQHLAGCTNQDSAHAIISAFGRLYKPGFCKLSLKTLHSSKPQRKCIYLMFHLVPLNIYELILFQHFSPSHIAEHRHLSSLMQDR